MIDKQFMDQIRYLVVEGPVGTGKSLLARKLSETFNSGLILERPTENPFLGRFYQDRRQFAFQTQLAYLYSRIQKLEGLRQSDLFHRHWVGNFFLERDLLFAELTLETDEFDLYRHIYERLAANVMPPGLVIFLQASVGTLQSRLKQRRSPVEHQVPADYLGQLVEGYARFFLRYKDAPLLMINVDNIDFINDEEDYRALLAYLSNIKSGRHFFNPLANNEIFASL